MATLNNLSLEILQHICGYIVSEYKPSVYTLALVSKRYYFASNRYRFRKIRLDIWSRAKLTKDLYRWNTILQNTLCFGNVHQLDIRGDLPLPSHDTGQMPSYRNHPTKVIDKFFNEFYETVNIIREAFCDESPQVTRMLDEDWKPLAGFLARLNGLRDLVFTGRNQFPACLLDILHESLPHCRLHLRNFRLNSLIQRWDQLKDVDLHDVAIATSPCLHSIVVPYEPVLRSGLLDYNHMAAMRIATGLAPNIKEVHMVSNSSPNSRVLLSSGLPTWRGFSWMTLHILRALEGFKHYPSGATSSRTLKVEIIIPRSQLFVC
ncbi:hypothetical protein FQN57_006863 [Myotisia sp. PD_48]|nr:hypothetical protein FQN57_006863 [Myotisia sp. PD_48]